MTVRQVIGTGVAWIPLAFLVDGVTMLLLPVRLGGSGGTATALRTARVRAGRSK